MEELPVGSSPHFINNSGLQIQEDAPRDVLAGSSLAEEGVEGVVSSTDGLIRRHLSIRLDTMLQAVEFPSGITNLDSSLSDMDGDTLTLKFKQCYIFNYFPNILTDIETNNSIISSIFKREFTNPTAVIDI